MRRRICRSVIGQFGFRSVRAVVTVVALSHERLTLSAAKFKEGGTFGMQYPSFYGGIWIWGLWWLILAQNLPKYHPTFNIFCHTDSSLRLTFSCRVPLGIVEEEAPVDTRVPLWVIPYSQTSMSDHLSLATTSYKRPLIQNTRIFPVKTLW